MDTNNANPSPVSISQAVQQNAIALGAISSVGASVIMAIAGTEIGEQLNGQSLTRDLVQMAICQELTKAAKTA